MCTQFILTVVHADMTFMTSWQLIHSTMPHIYMLKHKWAIPINNVHMCLCHIGTVAHFVWKKPWINVKGKVSSFDCCIHLVLLSVKNYHSVSHTLSCLLRLIKLRHKMLYTIVHDVQTCRFCDLSIKIYCLKIESQLPSVQDRFFWRPGTFCTTIRMK